MLECKKIPKEETKIIKEISSILINNIAITLTTSNIVFTGKLNNFKPDFDKIITKSRFYWQIQNEKRLPICGVSIKHHKDRTIYIGIFKSGKIIVTGSRSSKEAHYYLNEIIKDLITIGVIKNE